MIADLRAIQREIRQTQIATAIVFACVPILAVAFGLLFWAH